ncbi:hypothetical protein C8F04DRAFT_1205201, partial [Mycena alexandri]
LSAALHIPVKLLYSMDEDIIVFACRTISTLLSLGFDEHDIQVVIENWDMPQTRGSSFASIRGPGTPRQVQAVIDALLIAPLVCWAISNATSGGANETAQIAYLVSQGAIKPLCDILTAVDDTVVGVALDGLANILNGGEVDKLSVGPVGNNHYAGIVEASGGLLGLRVLERSENLAICVKAGDILARYFPDESDLDAHTQHHLNTSVFSDVGGSL